MFAQAVNLCKHIFFANKTKIQFISIKIHVCLEFPFSVKKFFKCSAKSTKLMWTSNRRQQDWKTRFFFLSFSPLSICFLLVNSQKYFLFCWTNTKQTPADFFFSKKENHNFRTDVFRIRYFSTNSIEKFIGIFFMT